MLPPLILSSDSPLSLTSSMAISISCSLETCFVLWARAGVPRCRRGSRYHRRHESLLLSCVVLLNWNPTEPTPQVAVLKIWISESTQRGREGPPRTAVTRMIIDIIRRPNVHIGSHSTVVLKPLYLLPRIQPIQTVASTLNVADGLAANRLQ